MKKVKYNDGYVYIDDTPVDEKETGILIPIEVKEAENLTSDEESLDKTSKIELMSKEALLENTITDLWGKSND